MSEATLIQGVNMALGHEMEVDPDVVVLGEDVGVNGGVFRATAGLLERFGAEIAAGLAERGLMSLLAPVQRVTGYDTVMPLYRLEGQYMPQPSRIVEAVKAVLEYA